MYDVADQRSFDEINGWIESIKEVKGDNFPIILIGNKCDLEKRVISKEEGEKLAEEQGFLFMETSCKEGINIKESVQVLVHDIMEKRKMKQIEGNNDVEYQISIKLSNKKKKGKRRKCCKQ